VARSQSKHHSPAVGFLHVVPWLDFLSLLVQMNLE